MSGGNNEGVLDDTGDLLNHQIDDTIEIVDDLLDDTVDIINDLTGGH